MNNKQFPLSFNEMQELISQFCEERGLVIDVKEIEKGRHFKLLGSGMPYQVIVYDSKVGTSLNTNIGKDDNRNIELFNYIDDFVRNRRLFEERVTFRGIHKDFDFINFFERYLIENKYSNIKEETQFKTTFYVKDDLVKKNIVIDFYINRTLYLNGYNTPIFDNIYNLFLSNLEVLPNKQNNLLNIYLKDFELEFYKNSCNVECSELYMCKANPEKFLQFIHFSHNKDYSCNKLIYSYIFKYYHRYVSEISYVLKNIYQSKSISGELSILSLGCGGSPELLAINELLPNVKLNYLGIDRNTLWKEVHYKNVKYINGKVRYNYSEIFDLFNIEGNDLSKLEYDLVFIQYFISSLLYNSEESEVVRIFKHIARRIFNRLKVGSNIVLCDINNGQYFVNVIEKLIESELFKNFEVKYYTFPSTRKKFRESTEKFNSSKIIFNISKDFQKEFNSHVECNSIIYIMRKIYDH